jgi:nitrogen fixation protein FixH
LGEIEGMSSRINWGTGMAALFGLFVVFMLGLVFYSATQSFHLVERDYYSKELDYQTRIEQARRTRGDPALFIWEYDKNQETVVFRCSGDSVAVESGEIHFYRPSDSGLDFRIPVQLNSAGMMEVSAGGLSKGLWKIKASITAAGAEYYKEDILIIE